MAAGCSKKVVELRVRDPGLVSVSGGAPEGWKPALGPDRQPGSAPLPPASPDAQPAVQRDVRGVRVTWTASKRELFLVDPDGNLPKTKSRAGITSAGGVVHVPYTVTPRGVFSIDEHARRPNATSVLLTTSTHNVEYGRFVEGRQQWPAYVLIPVGALFTLLGVLIIASADGEYQELERLGGGMVTVVGAAPLAAGIFIAADPPTISPLSPDIPTGDR